LGSHDGQLSEPWGIVVQDSRIYVADAQNHRITVFNDH
jgi:hypothetical protein